MMEDEDFERVEGDGGRLMSLELLHLLLRHTIEYFENLQPEQEVVLSFTTWERVNAVRLANFLRNDKFKCKTHEEPYGEDGEHPTIWYVTVLEQQF